MKKNFANKFLAILLAMTVLVGVTACGQPTPTEPPVKTKTVEEIEAEWEGLLSCDKYDELKYLMPVWESDVIYNETVLFLKNKDGSYPVVKLAYPIAKVLEVRSSTLVTVYEEGVDYQIVDGGIQLLEGTRIRCMDYDKFYTDEKQSSGGIQSISVEGKWALASPDMYEEQTCITYIRTEKYSGAEVKSEIDKLPKTVEKLNDCQRLNIVYYGDSITTGACTSGWKNVNVAPKTPIYTDMITSALKEYYQYDNIRATNTAVGGWTSKDGVNDMQARVVDHNPDLVILAFGMNDANEPSFTVEGFQENLQKIMDAVLAKNPDCEFILIAPMYANKDNGQQHYAMRQSECITALNNLAEKYEGTIVADLSSMHEWLMERKSYADFTDGIVHPTDFMSRIYAQVILNSLIDDFGGYVKDSLLTR